MITAGEHQEGNRPRQPEPTETGYRVLFWLLGLAAGFAASGLRTEYLPQVGLGAVIAFVVLLLSWYTNLRERGLYPLALAGKQAAIAVFVGGTLTIGFNFFAGIAVKEGIERC